MGFVCKDRGLTRHGIHSPDIDTEPRGVGSIGKMTARRSSSALVITEGARCTTRPKAACREGSACAKGSWCAYFGMSQSFLPLVPVRGSAGVHGQVQAEDDVLNDVGRPKIVCVGGLFKVT